MTSYCISTNTRYKYSAIPLPDLSYSLPTLQSCIFFPVFRFFLTHFRFPVKGERKKSETFLLFILRGLPFCMTTLPVGEIAMNDALALNLLAQYYVIEEMGYLVSFTCWTRDGFDAQLLQSPICRLLPFTSHRSRWWWGNLYQ